MDKILDIYPLKREAIMQTLPVMQAFFMFFLIILTPIVLSLSCYSPRALGSLCALFIMAIFLQYLWHLVGFLERSVLDPLGEKRCDFCHEEYGCDVLLCCTGIIAKVIKPFWR
jgi:hypothetical protein